MRKITVSSTTRATKSAPKVDMQDFYELDLEIVKATNPVNLNEMIAALKEEAKNDDNQFDMSATFSIIDLHESNLSALEDKAGKPFKNCGSAACLAGWAIILKNKGKIPRNIWNIDSVETLADYLGVSQEFADYLFGGCWIDKNLNEITADEAVFYLELLREGRITDLGSHNDIIDRYKIIPEELAKTNSRKPSKK